MSTTSETIADVVEAITAETALYLANPEELDEADAGDAAVRIHLLERRLWAVPAEEVALHPEYVLALALIQRRWLVCSGSYASQDDQTECRLVDRVLVGTRFDAVPLLWHINGVTQRDRPSDALLRAGWKDQSEGTSS